jgi:hypothetical protein
METKRKGSRKREPNGAIVGVMGYFSSSCVMQELLVEGRRWVGEVH